MHIVTIEYPFTLPRERHFVCSARPEFYPELQAYKVRGVEVNDPGLGDKNALVVWTWGILTDHMVLENGFKATQLPRTF